MTTFHDFYSDLSHLSLEGQLVFYERYLHENAGALVTEYKLNPNLVTQLYSLLPKVQVSCECNVCFGSSFKTKLPKKSDFLKRQYETKATCEACGHKVLLHYVTEEITANQPDCNCKACKETRSEQKRKEAQEIQAAWSKPETAEEKRARLIKAQNADPRFIPFSERQEVYKLADIVTLMSLMFARWDESADDVSSKCISPILDHKGLWPTIEGDSKKLFDTVFDEGLIKVDLVNSSMDHIVENDEGGWSFYTYKVCYSPNFKDGNNKPLDIRETYQYLARKFADGYWYRSWNDQLLPLWLDLGVSECIEYAKLKADEYNFSFNSETKISEIIRELLQEFSVSECYYFISTAYWNAASFLQSNRSQGRRHAENTIPGKILSLARSQNKPKEWFRPKEIPRSIYSQVLFDVILNLKNDAGFNLCPGEFHQQITNQAKVEWPYQSHIEQIQIDGSDGLNYFLGRIYDLEGIESTDTKGVQLVHLQMIAGTLGLIKAGQAIETLLSKEDIEYRDTLS